MIGTLYHIFYYNSFVNYPFLIKEIEGVMQQHGETLSPRYHKRFKKYSIMGMSLAEWMRGITGVKLSDNEYKAIGLFSALTALFDDLIGCESMER